MVSLQQRYNNYLKQYREFQMNREISRFNRHNKRSGIFDDLSRHIIISGEPRGGTTWLMELLIDSDHALVWEPLHPEILQQYQDPELQAGLGLAPYIPEQESWEPAEQFFSALLRGHLPLGLKHHFQQQQVRLRETNKLLFKFCRANLILPWLTVNFPAIRPIYLVRHPLAVISSQFRHPSWGDVGSRHYFFDLQRNARYQDIFQKFNPLISAIHTKESIFANWWSVRNILPISHGAKRWLTVSYESLYLHPHKELDRMEAWLGIRIPDEVRKRVKVPSATTLQGSAIMEGGNQLANWRKHLDNRQVEEILRIVHAYGIDAYSYELEPDYSKLGY